MSAAGARVAIVAGTWHEEITAALLASARRTVEAAACFERIRERLPEHPAADFLHGGIEWHRLTTGPQGFVGGGSASTAGGIKVTTGKRVSLLSARAAAEPVELKLTQHQLACVEYADGFKLWTRVDDLRDEFAVPVATSSSAAWRAAASETTGPRPARGAEATAASRSSGASTPPR